MDSSVGREKEERDGTAKEEGTSRTKREEKEEVLDTTRTEKAAKEKTQEEKEYATIAEFLDTLPGTVTSPK